MAKLSTFQDNYNDNSINTALWYKFEAGGAKVYERNNQIEITMPASSTSSTNGDLSNESVTYDFTNSSASIRVTGVPSSSTNANGYFKVVIDANNYVVWLYEAGTLYAQYYSSGAKTTAYSVTYSASTHLYWRLRQASGTCYWDTSANGEVWTNRATWVNAKTWTTVDVAVGALCYKAESNPGNFKYDDFNITPAYATLIYSNSNPYASGSLKQYTGSSWSTVTSGDMYFVTYSVGGATTVVQNSQEPADIARAALDSFLTYGGSVTYDGTSIDDTGTTVSYTFNTQTILECINKVLELSPKDWYYYVDIATNLLHLHLKSTTADHNLTVGKDIVSMRIEKRTEGITNAVYFRGGDTGGGVYLFKKYQDSNSIGLYGTRAVRYVDERVTNSTTADTIANKIIEANAAPEVRLTLEIADSNTSSNGYDIESIQVGDVVKLANTGSNSNGALYDVAIYDRDRYDFNITQLSSLYLQIVRKEYSPDTLRIICSTIPPDVSKRIEDINRNLEATQTADNPSAPS